MHKKTFELPELLYIFSFFLYLFGSSITLYRQGVELSLWVMTVALVINISTTILPWLGFNWLRFEKKGGNLGFWLAELLKIISWASFGYAMYFRLWRNLPEFYTLITITNLLWAAGLILFVHSRRACKNGKTGDKLEKDSTNNDFINLKGSE
jgi:signal transduction histidine kinase